MVNGGRMSERLAGLWLKPVKPLFPLASGAIDKPLAEVTVQEVLALAGVFSYMVASMIIAQVMAANLARVAIQGR